MNTLKDTLTAWLDAMADEYGIPGYDLSVFHRHAPLCRVTRGLADSENGTPITENTLYHIYSNTKVIACAAALQLYEKGLFRLNDALSDYFPEFSSVQVRDESGNLRSPARPILIRDLFTMTAGIGDGGDYAEMGMQFYMETQGACPVIELPKFLARVPLLFDPGSRFKYGICHEVLAALIEKLSGEAFDEYLLNHIFLPLGMKDTAFDTSRLKAENIAVQYSPQGKGQMLKNEGTGNVLIPPILTKSASGGLISTVNDYMRFQEALLTDGAVLKTKTRDLMRTNHLTGTQFDGYGYTQNGLGYGLGVRACLRAPGAFGWGGAAGTYGLIDPENELTLFYAQQVFSTRDIQGTGELADIIYKAL